MIRIKCAKWRVSSFPMLGQLLLLPICAIVLASAMLLAANVAATEKTAVVGEGRYETVDSSVDASSVEREAITNSIGMKLVRIPAGEFMMGNSLSPAEEIALAKEYDYDLIPEALQFEYPRHRVRITRPFYMGAHPVTRGQFRRFVEETGYKTDAERGDSEFDRPGTIGLDLERRLLFAWYENRSWREAGFPQTDEHPVVNVSWNDAMEFCKWLSRKEDATYRLPTEAEWEYACRAGTTTRYWCGNAPETLVEVGNTADAALKAKLGARAPTIRGTDGFLFTSPVGSFRANPFGLYDMHGNVWEWCADRMNGRYYEVSPVDDPPGPEAGGQRVLRGGSWLFGLLDARSAQRFSLSPPSRNDNTGFRVVRE